MKMRPDQRQEVVQNFRKASLPVACRQGHHPASTDSAGRTCPVTVTENPVVCGAGPSQPTLEVVGPLSRHLSIAAEDSGITLIPLVTLSVMWAKAEKLLQMKNAVTPAPGSNLRAKMVISYSHATPHYVQCKSDGQYMCDTPCLQWSSSQICSHTLAASECNQEMAAFLEWYTKFVESPNISKLAMSGLPRGRG